MTTKTELLALSQRIRNANSVPITRERFNQVIDLEIQWLEETGGFHSDRSAVALADLSFKERAYMKAHYPGYCNA